MSRTVHNMRLLALIALIAVGFMLEVRAGDARALAGKDCAAMEAVHSV